MSDKYLELANSKFGKSLLSMIGLPEPVALRREAPDSPHRLHSDIRIGSSSGAVFDDLINSALDSTEVNIVALETDAKSNLIFDASGIANVDQSAELYEFFHQFLPKLERCGRIVIVGHKPSALEDTEHATLQRGLVGFVKSVAKEIGRKGATANLLYVDSGGEESIAAPLRFLLSAGCAFTNAQVVTVAPAVAEMEADWYRPLQGKLVVVTGAARGIGRAISQVLARDGAQVIGVDIEQAQTQLGEAMSEIGGHALGLDITAQDAPQRLLEFCRQQSPKLHGIVHNAGVTRDKMLAKMTEHQWRMLMAVNLGSVQAINRALLDTDILDGGGRIIGIASISGIAGNVGQTNYGFSKSAVIGMVESMAQPCAQRGITINGVAPGFIETQMTAAIPFATRQIGRRISSLGQGGLPVDVAEVIGFYLSPQAAGVNGNMLRVCGQSLLGA
jgi:3-oxoacyl-[acyl-carrier protein] reductase